MLQRVAGSRLATGQRPFASWPRGGIYHGQKLCSSLHEYAVARCATVNEGVYLILMFPV